jgi:GTP cyclohydrolase I
MPLPGKPKHDTRTMVEEPLEIEEDPNLLMTESGSHPESLLLAIKALIAYIGDNPERDGVKETPMRVLNSYRELFAGYSIDPMRYMKLFEASYSEMVVVRNIEFYSMCEHHWLPFSGLCHVAYIPRQHVIGLSKIPRIVDAYARRLQIQEQLTCQIAETLWNHKNGLAPLGVACTMEAAHHCVRCRGVGKQQSEMVTSRLLGVFDSDPKTRAEYFAMIKS